MAQFSRKIIKTILMYILTTVIVQKFWKILRADPELRQHKLSDPI